MENRQWSINGIRLETLKAPTLPDLARAIVGYMRGFATVHAGYKHNVQYVSFVGKQYPSGKAFPFQVVIRGDDYVKLVPYIASGQFDPPPEPLLPWREGNVNISNIQVFDQQYYNKVLGVLQGIFTQDFPTSYL